MVDLLAETTALLDTSSVDQMAAMMVMMMAVLMDCKMVANSVGRLENLTVAWMVMMKGMNLADQKGTTWAS